MRRIHLVFGSIFIIVVLLVVTYEDVLLKGMNTTETIVVNNTVIVYVNNGTAAPRIINNTVYVEKPIYKEGTAPPIIINKTIIVNYTVPGTGNDITKPFIDHLEPTKQEDDTSDQWDDDHGGLRFITVMYKPTTVDPDLHNIRRLVGSIHDFEKEQVYTTVFGYDVPQDFYLEIRTFSFVRFIQIPTANGASASSALQYAMDTSRRLYHSFIYVSLSQKIQLAASMAEVIKTTDKTGKISFTSKDGQTVDEAHGFIRGSGDGLELQFDKYLTKTDSDQHGRCTLLRNVTSPYRTKHIFSENNENFNLKEARHNPEDKLICISIATYSGAKEIEVDEFSLMTNVMPSLLTSTKDVDTPNSRYRFAMYLGLQRDKFYDDPKKMEKLKTDILSMMNDRSFSLRLFYTPLNAPALDITYKWNVLIDQGYRDGCDYIYQYSDDTIFTDPWVDKFVRYLESESNFGIVGATDRSNPGIMTLAFSHRTHVSILGSFWPTHLKNWYSDTWAQKVYGKRYTKHFSDVLMENTQKQGQRYPPCEHEALFQKLKKEESVPRFIKWLNDQPQSYDVRQKLEYYQKGGEGAKRR